MRDFLKRIKYEDKAYRHTVYGNYKCVYAEDEEDACEIYKKRYPYKDIDYVIDYWYGSGYSDYDYDDRNCVLDKNNPEFSYEVEAQSKEEELTIKELKKYLTGEDIIDSRVKPVLKSKISEITTDYSMMDIYSGNRSKINKNITDYLNKEFKDKYGIEVFDASIIDVHPDKKLKKSIDNRVAALQAKQQAEAEQQKVKVQKETEKIKAETDAQIEITKAQAKAKANKILSNSITDKLIKMKEAEARNKFGWVTTQGANTVVTK